MTTMEISAFQSTLQTTSDWLGELNAELGREERGRLIQTRHSPGSQRA